MYASKTLSALAATALVLLSQGPSPTLGLRTACADGEVAIGTSQLCGLGSPQGGPSCQGTRSAIYANDCGVIAMSHHENHCATNAGWPSGHNVQCFSYNSVPMTVTTPGGRFGNCYRKGSNCSPYPLVHRYASFCCSRR